MDRAMGGEEDRGGQDLDPKNNYDIVWETKNFMNCTTINGTEEYVESPYLVSPKSSCFQMWEGDGGGVHLYHSSRGGDGEASQGEQGQGRGAGRERHNNDDNNNYDNHHHNNNSDRVRGMVFSDPGTVFCLSQMQDGGENLPGVWEKEAAEKSLWLWHVEEEMPQGGSVMF